MSHACETYNNARINHWDRAARKTDYWKEMGGDYHLPILGPIRYRERSYRRTNISPWRHGWLLLRMVLFAVRRIKFV